MNGSKDIRRKVDSYILKWELRGYPCGIPDEAPAKLEDLIRVPSYRMIVKALLKNETNLESLGFSRKPCDLYGEFKRIELSQRGEKICHWKQLKMF
jgi:predicted phosphoadenosine phosphosulfate sulfurtransferase